MNSPCFLEFRATHSTVPGSHRRHPANFAELLGKRVIGRRARGMAPLVKFDAKRSGAGTPGRFVALGPPHLSPSKRGFHPRQLAGQSRSLWALWLHLTHNRSP